MKKSGLISGKHILETRQGVRYLVAGNYLPSLNTTGWLDLSNYDDDLKYTSCQELTRNIFSIAKVYEIVISMSLSGLANSMDRTCKLVWERKSELSEIERVILENADKTYKYIARDKNGSLFLYSNEMSKFADEWCFDGDKGIDGNHSNFSLFNHLFKMVKWEDEEPTLISDLLEGKK